MQYDFLTAPDRTNTGASKWESMAAAYGGALPEGIVPFSVADMELKNPPEVAQGLSEFLQDAVLGYTQPTASYYAAVCSWMEVRHNWHVAPEWIVAFPGVVPAVFCGVRAFTQPGDGVIIMTPVYYPFYMAVEKSGRTLVENPLLETQNGYEIDFDDLEQKAKNPKNRLLVLCSPHNPVGRVWTSEELKKIGDICLKYDVTVLSDEIHFDLILPGYRHRVLTTVAEDFADNFVVCTAPSKTFNLAGGCCSNIIIKNKKLRERFQTEMRNSAIHSVNALGLKACEIVYTKCHDWLDQLLQLLERNKQLVENFMAENIPAIHVLPLEGTYLQWWDCRRLGMTPAELEEFMQKKALLFLDEGHWFGKAGSGFERINLAAPTLKVQEGLQRLAKALQD